MGPARSHENVEGGGEIIVDVYREIERMCDAALRNKIKDMDDRSDSVRAVSVLRMAPSYLGPEKHDQIRRIEGNES